MTRGGAYNEIDVCYATGGFRLEFEAAWDPSATALFGPSGSGKSTLLEIIAGVRPGASGRVSLEGRTIFDTTAGIVPPSARRWIGWVPQDAALFPHLTARDNIRYGLPRGGDEGERRLGAAIAALELEDVLPRRAMELSGGERQRVAVARAIGSGARVLLLDEPLAGLDHPLRSRVFPLFRRLRDELRLPMIYVSHDAGEVLALAEHVLVARAGRCVASGPARDVLGDAERTPAFDLHGIENRFEAELIEERAGEGTALLELKSGPRLQMSSTPPPGRGRFEIVIRAEEIIVASERPGRVSAQNVLEAIVVDVERLGGNALVTASVSGTRFVARITVRSLEELGLTPGTRIWLMFKASSIRAAGRRGSM